MVLKFLINTLVMNIGSKFHLYFDEVFEDMKENILEKYRKAAHVCCSVCKTVNLFHFTSFVLDLIYTDYLLHALDTGGCNVDEV